MTINWTILIYVFLIEQMLFYYAMSVRLKVVHDINKQALEFYYKSPMCTLAYQDERYNWNPDFDKIYKAGLWTLKTPTFESMYPDLLNMKTHYLLETRMRKS